MVKPVLFLMTSVLAFAQAPQQLDPAVLERLKKSVGNALLKARPVLEPKMIRRSGPLPGDGVCSVRMPRAGVGSLASDAKMVLPLDSAAVQEQYPMPQVQVPAPECAAAASPNLPKP